MTTKPTESTHEAEQHPPLPPDAPENQVESPSGDRLQGASGPPHADPDAEGGSADQDIDTAGTDADEQSPTKAMGTGLAPNRSRG
jgi:hypothetical protein